MNTSKYNSVFKSDSFQGKVVLITGGGSGIGRCVAHELASLGASVALVGRNQDKLDSVITELSEASYPCMSYRCDIRDEESVRSMVFEVIEDFGKIDHLVNNAGGQYQTHLEEISKKGWDAVVSNNLTGGFLVAREVFNQWMVNHGGSIVNMAMDMWNGMPMMGHSGAARAGMINFTMTAALEWAFANVRVNAVAPGLIFSSGVDSYPESTQRELLVYGDQVPLGRVGTEAETSAAIVFLLSEGAAYISGITISIDGATHVATPVYKSRQRIKESPVFNGFHLSKPPSFIEPLKKKMAEEKAAKHQAGEVEPC